MAKNRNKDNNWQNKVQLGDHHYYSCFNKNPNVVKALVNTTKEALAPYYNFLNEAIKAENKKGSHKVDWKLVESNYTLNITPTYSKFKIEKPKTIFKIFIEDMEILQDIDNKITFNEQDKIIRFDKVDIKIEKDHIELNIKELPIEDETIDINKIECDYKLKNLYIKLHDILTSNNTTFEIEKIEELDSGWNIEIQTKDNIKEFKINLQTIKANKYKDSFEVLYDGKNEFIFNKVGNDYQCEKLPKNKILKNEHNREYQWKRTQEQNNKKDIAIQLIDDDSNDDKSISEYFLQDDVREIYQDSNKKNIFSIASKKVDDKILILRQDWKHPKQLKKNEPISIKVDTGNLKKQQDSIKLLNDKPVKAQENLIKLFEKQNDRLWKNSIKKDIDDWYILNDESYDGTLDQREFVKKAIATDDFAILEGPPGSGKTTSILELILQLAKQGKKILLSASTHVAIDNVLERIDEYDKDKNIEALRVGRAESVGEAIKELQIDKKIDSYKNQGFSEDIAKKIVLDSANLVCGTTMGINQFPPIKDRNFKNGKWQNTDLPMDTIFDYMIIDESSKTTFQEFLVPAMLAKKWILVGDIKQLSPFVEQSHIVHNFKEIVPKPTQKAIRIVFETLCYYQNKNLYTYIVEVSEPEEREIKKYLNYYFQSKKDSNPYKDKVVSYSDEKCLLKKLGSDLILIKDNSWNEVKNNLPTTHITILKNNNDKDSFWFKQNYLNHKKLFEQFNKTSKENSPFDHKESFNKMLQEKDWAEEITWRMIRVYERRMLKNPDSYYEKTYELLKPIDKDNVVERIYNMTLPSILESIQIGNGETHRNTTTITKGFDEKDLKQRHETLKTQHRMHKDISKFSRKEFYTTNGQRALMDSKKTNRIWNYDVYQNHAVWLDVPHDNKDNKSRCGRHFAEVDKIISEIEKFLEFVKDNPNNNDTKPWDIAVLTFHKSQESILRNELKKLCSQPNTISRFKKDNTSILLYTVDKFQGMEADVVFISMAKYKKIGFLDNINRLNVAITRAKYQRVIVGDKNFFEKQRGSEELQTLAKKGGM